MNGGGLSDVKARCALLSTQSKNRTGTHDMSTAANDGVSVLSEAVLAGCLDHGLSKRLELLELAVIGQGSLLMGRCGDAMRGVTAPHTTEKRVSDESSMSGLDNRGDVFGAPSSVEGQYVSQGHSTPSTKSTNDNVCGSTAFSSECTRKLEAKVQKSSDTGHGSAHEDAAPIEGDKEVETFITTRNALVIVAEECEAVLLRCQERHSCEKAELEMRALELQYDLEVEQNITKEQGKALKLLRSFVDDIKASSEASAADEGLEDTDRSSEGGPVAASGVDAGTTTPGVSTGRVVKIRPPRVSFAPEEAFAGPIPLSESLPTRTLSVLRGALHSTAQSLRAKKQSLSPSKMRSVSHLTPSRNSVNTTIPDRLSSPEPKPILHRVQKTEAGGVPRPHAIHQSPIDVSQLAEDLLDTSKIGDEDAHKVSEGKTEASGSSAGLVTNGEDTAPLSALSRGIEDCVAQNVGGFSHPGNNSAFEEPASDSPAKPGKGRLALPSSPARSLRGSVAHRADFVPPDIDHSAGSLTTDSLTGHTGVSQPNMF